MTAQLPPPHPRRLVGLASILLDVLLDVPRLPPRGGDVVARAAGSAAGGGINAISAAARLGLAAAYAGPHGTGTTGDLVRAALAADGIRALLPPRPDGDSGYCLALVEPDGERTFVTVPGVEADPRPQDLAALALDAGDAVYASGYDLVYPAAGPVLGRWLPALPARPAGGPLVVLDPGPLGHHAPADMLATVLARCDVLTLTTREAGDLAAAVQVEAPGGLLDRLAPDAALLVRAGPAGGTLYRAGRPPLAVPGHPSPVVVDTTGAGDVHTGALLAALAEGASWPRALAAANVAAALSVAERGGATGPSLSRWRAARA